MNDYIAYIGILITIIGCGVTLYNSISKQIQESDKRVAKILELELEGLNASMQNLKESQDMWNENTKNHLMEMESRIKNIESFLGLAPVRRLRRYFPKQD